MFQSVVVGGASPARPTMAMELRTMWMLDVDGVLLNLVTKQVEEGLLRLLARCLHRGDVLTFNSGRAPLSIAELILSPLERHLGIRSLLSRVMVVGEKGGVWGAYTPDGGSFHITRDPLLTVPLWLKTVIGTLAADPEFAPLMTMEEGKHTMVTVVKRPGIPLAPFHLVQPRFASLAQQALDDFGLNDAWKIDVVSDAIEIEPKSADKGKATRRIMQWVEAQGIRPSNVVVIEDSPSGLTMSQVLHELCIPSDFVFTGVRELPPGPYPFPIIRTSKSYEQGTMEYFQNLADERRGW